MAGETFEHKLKLVLVPDTTLVKKAIQELQSDMNKVAPEGSGTGSGGGTGPGGAGKPSLSGGTPKPSPAAAPRLTTIGGISLGAGISLGSGTAFSATPDITRQLGNAFLDVARGRRSALSVAHEVISGTAWGGRMRRSIASSASSFTNWLGKGVGGAGPFGGALVGGGIAATGAGTMIYTFGKAIGQFVESVRLYGEASSRLVSAIVHADPAQLLLAGTTAQQAALRGSIWKGTLTGATAGGIAGTAVGGATTGGPGALIGGLAGGGIGAVMGYIPGAIMSWIKKMELAIQEQIFSMLDGLTKSLENYNATIFGLSRQFELNQTVFMFNLGRAASGLAAAWFGLKNATLSFLSQIVNSGALQPIIQSLINYLNQLQTQLPQIIGGMLIGFADLIDAIDNVRKAFNFVISTMVAQATTGVAVTSGLFNAIIGFATGIVKITAWIINAVRALLPKWLGGGTAPTTPTPATATPTSPGKGPATRPGVTAPTTQPSGTQGISAALRQAGINIQHMPAPAPGSQYPGGNLWSTFATNFTRLAFGTGPYATTRGQSGYPGVPQGYLGSPQSAAARAAASRTYSASHAAAASAHQAAKAPTSTAPQFHQNISLEFKAKLMHERAIYDGLAQVRERWLAEMNTVKNEARLSIALFDARLSALTL